MSGKNIILYTTHCQKCEILKERLDDKNISYEEVSDIKYMREKGMLSAPMIEVDGAIMNYIEAISWIKGVK